MEKPRPRFDPHTTDAPERRITTPIPLAPAVMMAVALAAITVLLLCVWKFTDINSGHLLQAVILGLGLPLLTIGALFYYSALARRLHVYSEGKHADRHAEHEALAQEIAEARSDISGLRDLVETLVARVSMPELDEMRARLAEQGGQIFAIQHQISAAVAGTFDPATKATLAQLNHKLREH